MKKYWLPIMLVLCSCAVGPDYVRPTVETPAAFKEFWKTAQPKDDVIRGKWWEIFGDKELNALEEQLNSSNQNIKAVEAQFRQARALADAARSAFFPTISANLSESRNSNGNIARKASGINTSGINNNYSASLDASWELDVWGRIRRSVESNEAAVQASAADLESARLIAQAELAADYFQLRLSDAQKRLFDDTVKNYERSLTLTKNQYAVGVAARSDVVQAETQLQSAKAQAIDINIQRAQFEHAIAILVGKAPSSFSITPLDVQPTLPVVPASVPSDLLQRRPDIAAAERRVQAANAEIGIAEAAFYPDIALSASGGFESSTVSKWFTVPSRFWSVGPSLAQTLFDGGLRSAQSREAIAAYDQQVANYRQTVLSGFQEVEDNLAALRHLEQEAKVQEQAVAAASESVKITTNQYKTGIVSYLNVVTVQATALANERTQIDILNRQTIATITLIKALGGGWNSAELGVK